MQILRIALASFIAALIVFAPLAYRSYRESHIRNFAVVREGVLYRSGQLSLHGLKRLIHDYGIKTIITLRDARPADSGDPDTEEEAFCRKEGYNYYRLPPRSWWRIDGYAEAEIGLEQFRKVIDDPSQHPILIHCLRGVHRTGTYCAIYRMDYEGWTNEQAIAELRAHGYDTLDGDWDVLDFLTNYRPGERRENSTRGSDITVRNQP